MAIKQPSSYQHVKQPRVSPPQKMCCYRGRKLYLHNVYPVKKAVGNFLFAVGKQEVNKESLVSDTHDSRAPSTNTNDKKTEEAEEEEDGQKHLSLPNDDK